MLGKIEGRCPGEGVDRRRWLDGIIDNGHELEQTDGKGQGSVACCSPRGCKELNTTEQGLGRRVNWSKERRPWVSSESRGSTGSLPLPASGP